MGEYRGIPEAHAFMAYCVARYEREAEEFAYRAYVTDSLKLHGEGKYLVSRWADTARGESTGKKPISVEDTLNRLAERGLEVIG